MCEPVEALRAGRQANELSNSNKPEDSSSLLINMRLDCLSAQLNGPLKS